ncbi:MAG: hypothetical protein ACRDNG_00890 [Gaiellaceae bacterium]
MAKTRLLALVGSLVAVLVLVLVVVVAGAPAASKARTLTLEVTPDFSTFGAVKSPAPGEPFPTGPFYIEGKIYAQGTLRADGTVPGARSIGTFRCWGWIFDGSNFGAAVNQRYELAQGSISTQGVEGTAVRDVTGGSGVYRAARGEGQVLAINPQNASFRITFTGVHPGRTR